MSVVTPIMDLRTGNAAYSRYWFDECRHLVFMGGAGSGKSYFCADKCILRMITEAGHRVCVFRKVARTIKRSVFALLQSRLSYWGLLDLCAINRTDFTIRFTNGSEIWCIGLDDQEKLKSIDGMSDAWVEEATEFTDEDLKQINLRMRGETPGYKQIRYSFNPISIMHFLKFKFFDNPPASCSVSVTTYRDNEYIDEQYKSELEEMGALSANFKSVYVDGQWGVLKGLIYARGFITDVWPAAFSDTFYGLDFGFNHPIALVRVDMHDDDPYMTEEIYESGMTTSDLVERMDYLEIPKGAIIYCDSAEPDRIEEIHRAGYTVKPAYKGPGSVTAGIDYCQSLDIHTKPDNVNFNAESVSYSWRVDRNDNPMDEPIKINDDAMDAMRYALYTHLGKPRAELFTFDRQNLGM
jgi:phage terminase large subunit